MRVDLVLPDAVSTYNEVLLLATCSVEGELGVMCSHENLVSLLVPSVVKLRFASSRTDIEFYIVGGTLRIRDDVCYITSRIKYDVDQLKVADVSSYPKLQKVKDNIS